MKTTPSPFLHSSGYHIPLAASHNDEDADLPGKNSDPKQTVTVTTVHAKPDVPENWDESWFANYE